MKVYFDTKTKKWFQHETEHPFTFGKNLQPITYKRSISDTMLPFSISASSNHVGPLIGIIVGESKNQNNFKGNGKKLRKIQLQLAKKGHICVVFTPSSISSTHLNGFVYVEDYKKWLRVTTPLPDIVYNRIPFRSMEKRKLYQEAFEFFKKNNIPCFNPYFFSKKQVYELLAKNPLIEQHLPATSIYTNKNDLLRMLSNFPILYAKSSSGHKGNGIYKINCLNQPFVVQTTKNTFHFSSLKKLVEFLDTHFLQEEFIIQEAIKPDNYFGKRYDLRVLVHYVRDCYRISGIGVRVSEYEDITTHVPNGGFIIPYSEIQEKIDESLLHELMNNIGSTLHQGFNQLIGEFSVDLCKARNGKYYLFEVNSKPMKFDERIIEDSGIDNLTDLLIMWGRMNMQNHVDNKNLMVNK